MITTEEKAKAYDEALERAKTLYENANGMILKKWVEQVFPELAKSDDEEIRKALINVFATHKDYEMFFGVSIEDIRAWLEKQGEPTDKGEISDGYHTFNELYYYRMLYNAAFFNMLPKEWVHKSKKHHDGEECFGGGWFIVMANLPTGQISNHYELKDWNLFRIPEKEVADKWDGHTPQEAADRLYKYLLEKQGEQNFTNKVEPKFKVGDFIVNDYCMGRVVEITNDAYLLDTEQGIPFSCEHNVHLWTIDDAKDGDVLANDNEIVIFKENNFNQKDLSGCMFVHCSLCSKKGYWYTIGGINPSNYIPATKEQRNLLFQKMKEAGYEWDAGNKAMTKIEQKPTNSYCQENCKGYQETGKCFADGMCNAKREAEQKPEENKGNIGGISPNWSEEDGMILSYIVNNLKFIRDTLSRDAKYVVDVGSFEGQIEWLQSLQGRVQPQPKQEWSEEDEQHVDSLLKRLDALCRNKFERTRFAISEDRDWLKSLRPQNRWKPSELQLGCLSDAIEHYNSLGYPASKLKELLDDLKKLKEE